MSEYIRTNKFDTNKCPNIFVKEKLIRTNVRIYIRDQYIRIFEYSNIRIYLSHSGQHHCNMNKLYKKKIHRLPDPSCLHHHHHADSHLGDVLDVHLDGHLDGGGEREICKKFVCNIWPMSRNCKVNEFDINTKYHGSHLGGGGEGGKIKLLVVLEFIFVTTFIITQPTTVQHCHVKLFVWGIQITVRREICQTDPWQAELMFSCLEAIAHCGTSTSLNNDKPIEEQYWTWNHM